MRWYAGSEYGRRKLRRARHDLYFPYRRATEITGASLNDVPERAGPKGPQLIPAQTRSKLFVANVDNHFRTLWTSEPSSRSMCSSATATTDVEKLVADVPRHTCVLGRADDGDA